MNAHKEKEETTIRSLADDLRDRFREVTESVPEVLNEAQERNCIECFEDAIAGGQSGVSVLHLINYQAFAHQGHLDYRLIIKNHVPWLKAIERFCVKSKLTFVWGKAENPSDETNRIKQILKNSTISGWGR